MAKLRANGRWPSQLELIPRSCNVTTGFQYALGLKTVLSQHRIRMIQVDEIHLIPLCFWQPGKPAQAVRDQRVRDFG